MINPNTPNQIAAEYEARLSAMREQLAEAQAKLAAVERDAKRYKAIRDRDFHVHKLFETYDCASSTANLESFFCLDDLDAAVDQAMKEGE